jgi:hypothetical protein
MVNQNERAVQEAYRLGKASYGAWNIDTDAVMAALLFALLRNEKELVEAE